MGMGNFACYADVIDEKDVKKLCPKEYKNFLNVLKKQNVDLVDFAKQYSGGDVENEKCLKAWEQLSEAFAQKTSVNNDQDYLLLEIDYHDKSDEGDRYDGVDGVFFKVDRMYQLTAAGQKFSDMITRQFFVKWG